MYKTLEILKFLIPEQELKKLPYFLILLILASALEIGALISVYPVINIFIDSNFSFELNLFEFSFIIENSPGTRIIIIVLFFLIYLFKAFFLIFFNTKLNKFMTDIISIVNERMYSSYLNINYNSFLNKNISNIVQIIQQESYSLFFYFRAISSTLIDCFFFTSVYLFLLILEPLGTLVLTFSLLTLYGFFYLIILKGNMSWGKERVTSDLTLSKLIIESFGALINIRIGNKEQYFEDIFKKESRTKSHFHAKQLTFEQMPRFFLETILLLSVLSFIAILNFKNYDQNEFLTMIGILIAASIRLIPSINSIMSSISILRYRYSSVHLVYKELFFNESQTLKLKNNKPIIFDSKIILKDLQYRYKDEKTIILDKLNLTIHKGKFIGIVGESGAGKSTLINLFCGLLKPISGDISVDNYSIYNNLRGWQSLIGYVAQKTFLVDETIAANIAFGLKENQINYKKVKACIKAVRLESLVDELELGLETKVGQDGSNLSGGQKQRIGIARALYSDPSIIIFDEATNSLDNDTEANLLEDLAHLKNSKTLVFISHNNNSLKICDEIYELRNKKLNKISNTFKK